MRKIPTIYERDWEGKLGPPGRLVLDKPHPDCDWVFHSEGVPTRKLDGTCCLVQDGKLYRRHEVKVDKKTGQLKATPAEFDAVYEDLDTGEVVGWVPVGDGPQDKWHRLAFTEYAVASQPWPLPDGTYELIGKQINGNPELWGDDEPYLAPHGQPLTDDDNPLDDVPTDFEGLSAWLAEHRDIEGIVWHHPDGRMAKIKGRDFGIARVKR